MSWVSGESLKLNQWERGLQEENLKNFPRMGIMHRT